MELILVRETWSHMDNVSGFDPLFSCFTQHNSLNTISYFVNDTEPVSKQGTLSKLFKRPKKPNISKAFSPFVELKHERLAQQVVKQMVQRPNALVMLSVTENQLAPSFTNLPDHLLKQLILFVHQPPSWFRLFWKDMSFFSKVKAVVCLCEEQALFFKSHHSATVIRIHHGVNLDFFTPPVNKQGGTKKLLFVGQWMRDMSTLNQAFKLLADEDSEITLHCVLQRRFRHHASLLSLAQSSRVFWYDHIQSDELRSLYQQADLLLLPLVDSTANNAFVEAAACGLPVVSTRVGGSCEYVCSPYSRLVEPGDAIGMARAVSQLLPWSINEPNWKNEIRNFAEENLNWTKQANHILNALNQVI